MRNSFLYKKGKLRTFLYFSKGASSRTRTRIETFSIRRTSRRKPYIEIGEKGPLASLEDSYRPRDRSISTLADDLVVDLTSCIKLAVEKAIPKSRTYKFSKL